MTAARALGDLVTAFLAGTLPRAEWTHEAHLRIGAWHVHHHGADGALPLLRERIRRLNDRHGTVNSATSGYHETITAAYARLIADFLAAAGEGADLEARLAALLASRLADRAALFRFWSRERLLSPEARAAWLPPDLTPLRWPAP
ncbi:MAG TPA: hypothetical protein VI456_11855 [Polyangia bacterium]